MKIKMIHTVNLAMPLVLSLSLLTACPSPVETSKPGEIPNTTSSNCTDCERGTSRIKGVVTTDGLKISGFNTKALSTLYSTTVKASSAIDTKEVKAKADGSFSIDVKAGADYTLEADVPDGKGGTYKITPAKIKVPVAQDPQVIDVKSLVTKDIGSIQGLVELQNAAPGETAQGADVFINGGTTFISKVGDDGRFTLTKVPEGVNEIVVQKEGFETSVVRNIKVTKGKTIIIKDKIVLKKPIVAPMGIKGIVQNASGQFVVGAIVTAYPKDPSALLSSIIGNFIGVTNQNGEFQITNMPKGDYQVQVYKTFYGLPDPVGVNLLEGVKSIGSIKLKGELTYFGKISGKVADESGKPLNGVLAQTDPPVTDQKFSDSQGSFKLDRILGGEYNVSLSAAGYCTVIKPLRVENVQDFELNIEDPIVMKKGTDCSTVDKQETETITVKIEAAISASATVTVTK